MTGRRIGSDAAHDMLMRKVTTRSFWATTARGVPWLGVTRQCETAPHDSSVRRTDASIADTTSARRGSRRRCIRIFALVAALLCTVVSAAASSQPRPPTAEQQREVDRLTVEHRARMQQNDYASASASARQLWALKQKIYGADADEAEHYRQVLAETLDVGGHYGEALDLFHQLAETAVKHHGAGSREEAEVLQRMESLLNTLQRWDELDTVYQRVLAIKKKLGGESSRAYVAELGSYAAFLASRTQYAAARQVFEQQIKLAEQL